MHDAMNKHCFMSRFHGIFLTQLLDVLLGAGSPMQHNATIAVWAASNFWTCAEAICPLLVTLNYKMITIFIAGISRKAK
jgi:hypothetical protein